MWEIMVVGVEFLFLFVVLEGSYNKDNVLIIKDENLDNGDNLK